MASHKNVVAFFTTTNAVPIPDINPPPSFPALNILYLKVLYLVKSNGKLSAAYDYDSDSGFYPLSPNINAFIDRIRQPGPWDTSDRVGMIPTDTDPPVPIVMDPCYVVFSVDFQGQAQLDTTTYSVMTDDSNFGDYFNLRTAADSATTPSPTHIAYFNCISPTNTGRAGQSDSFNLQFLVKQPDGSMKSSTLDPAIKNTGH